MDLQEVNSNIQNSSAVPLIGSDGNCMQEQLFKVTANEAQAGLDLQGEGNAASALGKLGGHGSTFSSMILPLCPSAHGILTLFELF